MIKAGIIVKRIPQITKNLDKLSHSYYLLKNAQQEDGSRPFETEFYFKKGSLGESKWNLENSGKVGSQVKQPLEELKLVTDRSDLEKSDQSLDRKLEKDLFLVQQFENSCWEFPSQQLLKEEFLHETSDRLINLTLGEVDVWRVGQAPIGHIDQTFFIKYHILPGSNPKSGAYAWLDKDECKSRMTTEYYKEIQDLIS
jgi:hypothetical protein